MAGHISRLKERYTPLPQTGSPTKETEDEEKTQMQSGIEVLLDKLKQNVLEKLS